MVGASRMYANSASPAGPLLGRAVVSVPPARGRRWDRSSGEVATASVRGGVNSFNGFLPLPPEQLLLSRSVSAPVKCTFGPGLRSNRRRGPSRSIDR